MTRMHGKGSHGTPAFGKGANFVEGTKINQQGFSLDEGCFLGRFEPIERTGIKAGGPQGQQGFA
jgi:hypothetical protein